MKTDIEILYRDRYIAVCVKPVGVNSQGSVRQSGNGIGIGLPDMPELIRHTIGMNDAYIGTVHRLDKNVGGIMVYSLDENVTDKLVRDFASRECIKEYYAVIAGYPEKPDGVLTDLLYHDVRTNKTFVVRKERKGVKKAELEYKTVKSVTLPNGKEGTAVTVILHTGRTHQIRVQFASRKNPVYGDARYGGGNGNPMLFAHRLTFKHPVTGETMTFSKNAEWE